MVHATYFHSYSVCLQQVEYKKGGALALVFCVCVSLAVVNETWHVVFNKYLLNEERGWTGAKERRRHKDNSQVSVCKNKWCVVLCLSQGPSLRVKVPGCLVDSLRCC